MISALCSGSYLGTAICYPLSALILQNIGWRSILFAYGGFGFVWGVMYLFLVSDTPEVDRRIHPVELEFIMSSQRGSMSNLQSSVAEPLSAVLQEALHSRAAWALMAASFCNNFGFYVLVSELPTFMLEVLHISEEASGIVAVFPYVGLWLVTLSSGVFADYMVRKGTMKLVKVRRLCFAIAEVPPAFLLLAAGYVPGDAAALACLLFAIACNGFFNCSISANVIDVGGCQSAVLYGLCNTAGTLPAIFAEPIFGIVTDKCGYVRGFQISFWICFCLYLAGATIFGLASSGQPFLQRPAPSAATA
jgi:sugar phosphate permease